MSEEAVYSHEAGRHYILNFRIYCSSHHNEAGIIKCFVLFGNCEWDAAGVNCDFWIYSHHSIKKKHAGCAILSLYDSLQYSVFQISLNLYWKMWKTVVKACKLLKSLPKKPQGSSNEILLNYYLSFAWWRRWTYNLSVSQFFSLFFKILHETGRFIIL